MTPSNNVPAFTDADLKRVKDELAANRRMEWPMPDCEAFIARLEAATNLTIYADHLSHCGSRDKDDCTCGLPERLEAWLRSKGEGL